MDGLLFLFYFKTFHELEELAINLSKFEGRKLELFTMSPCLWDLFWPSNPCFIPHLSLAISYDNWVPVHETGYQFQRFVGSYSDNAWFIEAYEPAVKMHVMQIQNWGWNSPEDPF
jgi:hypothetical protein